MGCLLNLGNLSTSCLHAMGKKQVFVMMLIFWCTINCTNIFRKTLGWQQQEYIALKTLRKSLGIIILMLLIPFLKMFHISDINLLIICNLLNGLGFLLASISMFYMPLIFIGKDWAKVLPNITSRKWKLSFLAGTILIPFQFPKYALARSLLRWVV